MTSRRSGQMWGVSGVQLACGQPALAVMALIVALTAATAEAGWHHRNRGSAGSAGGTSGSVGGSVGASTGDQGSMGGSIGGSHDRRHGWRGRRHGSQGGSVGSSHGGSAGGSYGGSAGGSYGGTLVLTPESIAGVEFADDAVLLTVEVPRDAKVWINGQETASTGELRLFTAAGMTPLKKYPFTVRMRAKVEGKWVDETTKLNLEAGERDAVSLAKVLEEKAAALAKPGATASGLPAAPAGPEKLATPLPAKT